MASIPYISEPDATEELQHLYKKYRAPWGGMDHILKIHSLLPSTMEPHIHLYRTLMFGKNPLTRRQRELIATVVSRTNQCSYCIHHHSDALLRVTKDKEFVDAVRNNRSTYSFTDAESALIQYAKQLTLDPSVDHTENIQILKINGFTNEALLAITLIVSYFNFVNRLALGLTVELEEYWNTDGYSDPNTPVAHDA